MKLVAFILFILFYFSVNGQNMAQNYFNDAAKMYVINNTAAALEIVNEGLSKYPSDKKLIALKKKLEDKKDKNKDKDKDKNDHKNKDKDKKDGDKDKKDDKGKEKDKPNNNEGKNEKDKDKPNENGKPKPLPGGISQQRLENLLDAVNNEEKNIQEKVNAKKAKGKPTQTEKDW